MNNIESSNGKSQPWNLPIGACWVHPCLLELGSEAQTTNWHRRTVAMASRHHAANTEEYLSRGTKLSARNSGAHKPVLFWKSARKVCKGFQKLFANPNLANVWSQMVSRTQHNNPDGVMTWASSMRRWSPMLRCRHRGFSRPWNPQGLMSKRHQKRSNIAQYFLVFKKPWLVFAICCLPWCPKKPSPKKVPLFKLDSGGRGPSFDHPWGVPFCFGIFFSKGSHLTSDIGRHQKRWLSLMNVQDSLCKCPASKSLVGQLPPKTRPSNGEKPWSSQLLQTFFVG